MKFINFVFVILFVFNVSIVNSTSTQAPTSSPSSTPFLSTYAPTSLVTNVPTVSTQGPTSMNSPTPVSSSPVTSSPVTSSPSPAYDDDDAIFTSSSNGKLGGGAIAGIVIAAVFVVLLGLLIYFRLISLPANILNSGTKSANDIESPDRTSTPSDPLIIGQTDQGKK